MTAPYVPDCPHHDYFRFMAPVYAWQAHPMRAIGYRAACIACDNGLSDEVARHHLEGAYARGTAVPDGVVR